MIVCENEFMFETEVRNRCLKRNGLASRARKRREGK